MQQLQHSSNNMVLQPPEGVPNDQCRPLPVTRIDVEGMPATVSFWKPDSEELSSLLAGHPVMLYVFGDVHPPVALTVESRHAPVQG